LTAKSKVYAYHTERDTSGKLVKKYLGRANQPHVLALLEVKRLQEAQQEAADRVDQERLKTYELLAVDLSRLHRAIGVLIRYELNHETFGFVATSK
jgi:hypothetical protein